MGYLNHSRKLNTPLRRALFHSPLGKSSVLATLLLIAVVLLLWAHPQFHKYYFRAPVQMLAGILLAVLVYSPTLFMLAYMQRRKRIAKAFFWSVPLSIILFFGPLTSATNNLLMDLEVPIYLFVGFSEESWKIMPLLLIMVFARPAVTTVRDGVFYGALGGFGFACLEMAAYFALDDFPATGWSGFLVNSLGRATFFGTDMHIIFSAFLGGAIVYGLQSTSRWKKVLIPLSGYLLVVIAHGLQDSAYGKILAVLPLMVLEPVFEAAGVTEESVSAFAIPLVMLGSSFNLLIINIVLLPLLIWMVLRGGKSERATISQYLQDETEPLILAGEKHTLADQKRWHRRKIGTDTKRDKTIVRAQNEFTFRVKQLQWNGRHEKDDLIAESLREEIRQLR